MLGLLGGGAGVLTITVAINWATSIPVLRGLPLQSRVLRCAAKVSTGSHIRT
jgi:hypothetical protein